MGTTKANWNQDYLKLDPIKEIIAHEEGFDSWSYMALKLNGTSMALIYEKLALRFAEHQIAPIKAELEREQKLNRLKLKVQ